ncbi:MAG: ribonucleotide-diphosphate reductase subunit beta [Acidobacteria bacterium]|nr:ribonucleotide-diphosphate reductase subunit beta [Acidobacteriota bacterium]
MLLDPGFNLTLRPMRYPHFYEMYRNAIKNTWFYLTLLDTYIPDHSERAQAFAAVENIPSIRKKAEFCMKWIDSIDDLDELLTKEHRRKFLLNLICFATCIEGLFFFAAFAYVYFLRSKGLLPGLASGTNWVFRDESAHMSFAFEVVGQVRKEEADLFDADLEREIATMLDEAVECEVAFAEDILSLGVAGLSVADMRQYLEFIADQRLVQLGLQKIYNARNPFSFMDLQDVQELANFFERRVSAYQVAVAGDVSFNEAF